MHTAFRHIYSSVVRRDPASCGIPYYQKLIHSLSHSSGAVVKHPAASHVEMEDGWWHRAAYGPVSLQQGVPMKCPARATMIR